MSKYQCPVCEYVYDEEVGPPREGFPAGSPWSEVPDDWNCPDCGVRVEIDFEPVGEPVSTTTVIVGAGIAGASAAVRLRSGGCPGRVVLIGDEPHPPYRRPPLSKDLLSGKTPEERIRIRPQEAWSQQGIELRTGMRVVAL